jgi:hypothetical protein
VYDDFSFIFALIYGCIKDWRVAPAQLAAAQYDLAITDQVRFLCYNIVARAPLLLFFLCIRFYRHFVRFDNLRVIYSGRTAENTQ